MDKPFYSCSTYMMCAKGELVCCKYCHKLGDCDCMACEYHNSDCNRIIEFASEKDARDEYTIQLVAKRLEGEKID